MRTLESKFADIHERSPHTCFPRPTLAGGRLVYQYVKKSPKHPHCAVSGARLNGVGAASMEHNGLVAA